MKNMRDFDLSPRTADEINECSSPEGMRRRLFRYSFEHPMTRAIFDSSNARGLSGEDRMTWLAFEALRRLETLEDSLLERAMTEPMPPMLFTITKAKP